MTRYLGGLITKDESQVIPTDNYQTTSAPGVWTLEEALMLAKQSLWPTAGVALTRGIFSGGEISGTVDGSDRINVIQYIDISSTGNAIRLWRSYS